MSKTILPDITSTDISSLPDQAAYKINRILRQLRQEIADRQDGDGKISDDLTDEINNRINADTSLQNQIDTISGDISGLIDRIYPIGSYYETSDTTFDPNVAWGGTWVLDNKGRVTVSQSDSGTFSTIGATGGSETQTLTANQLPNISGSATLSHNIVRNAPDADIIDSASGVITKNTVAGKETPWVQSTISTGYNISDTLTVSFGNGQAHNNLQPYVVVRRWHRVS